MYNLNVKRILSILRWEMNSENIQKIEQLMLIIPEESRKVIEIRWGLIDDTKVYYRFSALDKAMGINNSKELYYKAIEELRTSKYVNLISDRDKFCWKQAVALGQLAVLVLGRYAEKDTIVGEELLNAIETLTSREMYVVTCTFGLKSDSDYNIISLEEMAKNLGITMERVRQIQAKALRKLRHPSRAKEFSMDVKKSYEKSCDTIDSLGLSIRTWSCLTREGINTVEEFKKLTSERLLMMRNLGRSSYSEIAEIREKMGLSLE